MPSTLVYQAYGQPGIRHEAAFSILSAYAAGGGTLGKAVQVVVYTDAPAELEALLGPQPAIRYQPIAADQWQQWRGNIDFVHRVKIEVLRHAAAHYAGPLLYLDTDTLFERPPAEVLGWLAAGPRLMHAAEGTLGQGGYLNRKIGRYLRRHGFVSQCGGPVLNLATPMYNAGVLGLHPADAPLLDQVLCLTDELHRFYPKHVMEQLAFSAVLSAAGPVRAATPGVFHYWNLKEARPLLAAFFARYAGQPLPALLPHLGEVPLRPLSESKLHFERRPGWQRTLLRWLGRAWRVPA
ncbi:MAG: hypothetical protein ACRYFK_05490 [Janthinobacterium lividum]